MKKSYGGNKEKSNKFEMRSLVLNSVQLIGPDCDPELLNLKPEYDQIDKFSKATEKAAISLIGAIITHRRIHFAMTRKSLQQLMLKDPNTPEQYRTAFSPNEWSRILSHLYNNAKLIKLTVKGQKRKMSAFEVVDVDLLAYLTPKVDAEAQLIETLKFCQKKG